MNEPAFELRSEVPEDESGLFLCPTCKHENSQRILAKTDTYNEYMSNGQRIQFWDTYCILQCNGCTTISFCKTSWNSEEVDFDSKGYPTSIPHRTHYPEITELNKVEYYVEDLHVKALANLPNTNFDTTRLIKMIRELNNAYAHENYLSCSFIVRAIIDHIPPVFGFNSFTAFANNYGGAKKAQSFKAAMQSLDITSRKIADSYIHTQIRKTESLPTKTQVDFRAALDLLLAEITRYATETAPFNS